MSWKKSFQLAFIYVGTIVGAGFATGKEIVEFFSQYGFMGLIGICISGLCFIGFGVKIMLLAIELQARSFQQLNVHIFGPYFAPVINLIMFVMLVGVTSVMLSGAGSVFQEQLHLPKMAGILITIIFTLIVLLIGTRGLVWVNTFVVPVLILFSFLLAYLAFHLPDFMGNVAKGFHFTWGAIIDSFAYAAFNISLATAVLVPAATEIGDKKTVKRGSDRWTSLDIDFDLKSRHPGSASIFNRISNTNGCHGEHPGHIIPFPIYHCHLRGDFYIGCRQFIWSRAVCEKENTGEYINNWNGHSFRCICHQHGGLRNFAVFFISFIWLYQSSFSFIINYTIILKRCPG